MSLVIALLCALGPGALHPSRAQARPPYDVRGEHFVDPTGAPTFLLGVNYEGPADRAWQMWEDGRFESRLISADLGRARAAGVTVVRLFVQQALATDLQAGRWDKLDEVLRLADQAGLQIILTFADHPDNRLANLAAIDTAVATRYRGRSTILSYDLKNEPRFFDLALGAYPSGAYVALQDPALIPVIGETVPRDELETYRASEEGQARVPSWVSDERAYVYVNVLSAYLRWMADAQAWASAQGSTTVAFLMAPESAVWDPFEEALNDTLATWMSLRLSALRAADPDARVTVGHVDPVLASLPANNWLDYRTLHRYPSPSPAGLRSALALFQDVQRAVPGKPLVLGEFGFATSELSEEETAALETEFVRGVQAVGGAGALKWMLNDFPLGANARENSLGMFRADGTPKPVVAAYRALGALTPSTTPAQPRPADYAIPEGHFFTQTSGRPASRDPSGFHVSNAEGLPFWETWQRLGISGAGYPLSRRFLWQGFPTQVFQKVVLQWQPGVGMVPVNLFDDLHDRGFDSWLQARELIPPPIDPATEATDSWEALVARRLGLLEAFPAIGGHYRASSDPLWQYGLPTSAVLDQGDVLALRTQRAVLFQWKREMPWAAAGEVTVANGGEIGKALNLFPLGALVPEPAPPV